MNTNKQTINQLTVLSLLVIYVFVVLMFIAYLPKINNLDFKFTAVTHTGFFHKNAGASNTGLIVQRGIKTVIDNKRKNLVPVTAAFVIAFFLIFSGLLLTRSENKYERYTGLNYTPHLYLSLRTLRI